MPTVSHGACVFLCGVATGAAISAGMTILFIINCNPQGAAMAPAVLAALIAGWGLYRTRYLQNAAPE